MLNNVPFLNVTEFLRAKMRAWTRLVSCSSDMIGISFDAQYSRRSQDDAEHVIFVLTRYWAQVDINRIQEDDMDRFVIQSPAAATAWKAIKRRYRQ